MRLNNTTLRLRLESDLHGVEYFDNFDTLDELCEALRGVVNTALSLDDGVERLVGVLITPGEEQPDDE